MIYLSFYWPDLEPDIAELTPGSSGVGRVANVGVGEVIAGRREGLPAFTNRGGPDWTRPRR